MAGKLDLQEDAVVGTAAPRSGIVNLGSKLKD
jgi:hypothetical protein